MDSSPGTTVSQKFQIGKDVLFQARLLIYSIPAALQHAARQYLITIKFSHANCNKSNMSIRLQSKVLNLIKKYAVDDSDSWRSVYESSLLPSNIVDLDLIVEYELKQVLEKTSFAPLYEDTELIDFELRGDDGAVQIHSTALAASSPAFHRMLEVKWKETQERAYTFADTSKETLQHLKDYIYLGVLPQTGIENLLLLASCYMMDALKDKCTMQIIETLNADNLIAFSKFALENNLTNLYLGILECVQNGSIKVKNITP